jgi:hypothetical protein
LNFTLPGLATTNTCTASISDNPTNPNADPLVLDSAGNQIGTDIQSLHGDDVSGPFELPFSLLTPTGKSQIRIGSNGVIGLNAEQTAISVFNADLDISTQGSLFTGACNLTWNGVTSPAYFVTWDDVAFYGGSDSHVTMQLIFVKTSDWSYSVIRNYSRIATSNPEDNSYGYECPFGADSNSCSRVLTDYSNTDTVLTASGSELVSGGTSDLTQHHTTNTTQIGRYIYSRSNNVTLCDNAGSSIMTVTYSEPGAQSANSDFPVITENFDSFTPGQIPTPTDTAVGLLEGDAVAFPADLYGGAGHTGNGLSANNATITAPAGTCYKYLGFWWSAGSPNNAFQLLDENNHVLANFTAEDLYNNLARVPGQPTCPDASNEYCGNPNHDENSVWADDADEPFAYLNIRFPAGFKKLRMYVSYSAWGFELDNVSLATVVPQASGSETFLSGDSSTIDNSSPSPSPSSSASAGGHSISFHSNGQNAIGTMANQAESTSTSINQNTFTRAGFSFSGWSTTPDGQISYQNGDNFDFQSDLDLYAIWSALRPGIAPYEITRTGNSFLPPTASISNELNALGEGWFICDSQHAEFDLSDFPSDCSPRDGGGSPFAVAGIPEGKYLGYGFDALNNVGHTFALKTISDFQLAPIWAYRTSTQFFRDPITIYGRITSVTQSWYRCTNPAADPTALPLGCTDTGDYGLEYHPTFADLGKYMVYAATATDGVTTQTQIHDAGDIVTIETLVGSWLTNFTVSVNNILGQASHTTTDASPKATYSSGQWYACDYPQDQINYNWPYGTTADVERFRSQALSDAACVAILGATADSVPVDFANSGKFLAWAAVAANNDFEVFRIVSVQIPDAPATPVPSPSPSAPSSSSPSPISSPSAPSSPSSTPVASNPAPSPSAPALTPAPKATANPIPQAPVEPKPVETQSDSYNSDSNSKTTKQSASGLAAQYPSGELEPLESVVVPPTVAASPQTLTSVLALKSFIDPIANPAIGATGVDGQNPEVFEALASPATAKTFTQNLSQLFAMLAGLTLAGVATTRAASRKKSTGGVPGNLDASQDPFASTAKSWGDKLVVWKLGAATFLDKPSVWLTIRSAKLSPLVSKILNDGSYLRSIFGSLTLVVPAISAAVAIYAVQTSGGLIANTAWTALLLLSWIAIFDALAGFVGIVAYAISFWLVAEHVDVWQDIRVLLGTAVLIIGPSLLMTAFRTIRRQAALGTRHWWERVSDLAIGPFISGWSTSIFISALPAIAGKTLSVANHVLIFAALIALSAVVRVLAEEFAAQNYPHRMDILTPDQIPDSSRTQKALSLAVRYFFWVFMAAGVLGSSWQLWVGSAIVLVPQVLSWYEDEVPNSPTIWRLLPTGVPGLAFGLLVTGWTTTVLSYLVISSAHLAKWAFVILPMPLIVFALLASFGRFGETENEIKPTQRNKYVYRIGGVVMLAITMRLAGIY